MKKILPFLILLTFSVLIFGQSRKDTIRQSKSQTITIPAQVNFNLPNTLQIKDITDKNVNQSFFQENMPWIVALFIGVLSVFINFWVAHRLRQSNERSLQNQIESNERNLLRQIESNERNSLRQIESNEKSLQRQIETAKETSLVEFKVTIATKNRQEWINELRQTLSEYLSNISLINFNPKSHSQTILDDNKIYIRNMSLSKAKLELLMNKDKPEQKELLEKIESMLKLVTGEQTENHLENMRSARSSIIIAARELFKIHWEKIKELK